MLSESKGPQHVNRSNQRKTKFNKQQRKSKGTNHNTSKLINTVESRKLFWVSQKKKQVDWFLMSWNKSVEHSYESDQYSRMCPGKKEFVSVKINGVKQHKQKRLLLCNLKEMHTEFLTSTYLQIDFSKFCQSRPKWCITVNSGSGIYSAWVCEIHQNVKLLTTVLTCDYKELLALMVCNMENRDCMLHSRGNCPGENDICDFLTSVFVEADDDEVVPFKQWIKNEKFTNLTTFQLPLNKYIDELCSQLDKLWFHHFVSKAQAAYLRDLKDCF